MSCYFTLAEANAILPDVIKRYELALAKNKEVFNIERQLQSLMSSDNKLDKYVELKKRLNSAVTQFYQSIQDLEETGVVVKSIENGLLDFPSMRFDQEVWLCWKYGETVIKFWHEKDVGFMGRKPLEIDDGALR